MAVRCKALKIFVSSTFLDLERERDGLARLFPQLERETLPRNLALRAYDLRFRDRHRYQEIVDWCIETVQECQYFIGILGQRYGWRPPTAAYGQDNVEKMSVTEMEIAMALQKVDKERRFFCFAEYTEGEGEMAEDRQSLTALKQRLREGGEEIYEPKDAQELVAVVEQRFRAMVDGEYPPEQQQPLVSHDYHSALAEIVADKAKGFVGRQQELQSLHEFAEGEGRPSYLAIQAVAGTGKSALLAHFIQQWQQQGRPFVAHYMSMGLDSRSRNGVLRSIGTQLAELGRLDELSPDPATLARQVYQALLTQQQPLLLVIDGIDEIDEDGRDLQWLPPLASPLVRVVISTRPVDTWQRLQQFPHLQSLELTPLEPAQIDAIVANYLKIHKLPPFSPAQSEILRQRACGNPLFLKVALDEVVAGGSDIAQLAESVEGLFDLVVARLEKQHGHLVRDYLGLLAASREGVLPEELAAILKQAGNDIHDHLVLRLEKALANFLVRRSGFVQFFHPEFERGVKQRLLGRAGLREYHQRLAQYLASRGYSYIRTLDELPYQRHSAEQYSELLQLLADRQFLEAKALAERQQNGMVLGLIADFAAALQRPDCPLPGEISYEVAAQVTINRHILQLLHRALQMDTLFLRLHPQCLLQTLWNRCYWHDAPEAEQYYEQETEGQSDSKVYRLVEYWREQREQEGSWCWLQSQRPLPDELDSPLRQILHGHDGLVSGVAINADGTRIVSGGNDNTIYIWDGNNGCLLRALAGHSSDVTSVAISADGTRVISSSRDKTVRIWNGESGELLHTLPKTSRSVLSVAITPDGTRAVLGSRDNAAYLVEVETGRFLHTFFEGHSDWVTGVAISTDGTRIATVSSDKTLGIWDGISGQRLHKLTHPDLVESVAMSADGICIVTGSRDSVMRIWNGNSGELLREISAHSGWVSSLAITSDGAYIVSGSTDSTMYAWDSESGKQIGSLVGHSAMVRSIAISPEENRVVSGSQDKTVRIWDIRTGRRKRLAQGHSQAIETMTVKNGLAVSGSRDGSVCVWDLGNNRLLHKLQGHARGVSSIASSADGKRIVSGSFDQTARVWDTLSGELLHELVGHQGLVNAVSLNADGNCVVSGSRDKTVRIWDGNSGYLLHTLRGHLEAVTSVATSADGLLVVSGARDATARIWDANSGQLLQTLKGHEAAVFSVAISCGGRLVATGSRDAKVRIWDANGQLLHTFPGHPSTVAKIAISADNQYAISASANTLCLRNIASGDVRSIRIITRDVDVEHIAATAPLVPFYAYSQVSQTIVNDKSTEQPLAFFPDAIDAVQMFADKLIGYKGDKIYMMRLRGASQ